MATVDTAAAARAGAPAGRSRRISPWRRGETRSAYLFLAPWIIGFLVLTAGPMLASLVLSFTDYDILTAPEFVGLANYRELVSDPDVYRSLGNTVFYTVLHVPLSMAISLALAMLLIRLSRGSAFFRTVIYLPVMTPPVAIGALFLLLLNGQTGLVNAALGVVGIQGPQWTTDPGWIKPGIVLMSLWTVGASVVIFLAALREVPEQLYEAATVDGASGWRLFRYITLPMISPSLFFVLIVNTIGSLQMFTEVYTMFFGNETTRSSSGDAALFYVVYLFQQAFQFLHMGYASAMAWLLFLIVLVITLIQVRVSRRFVYYEGE
ncbi:MAG: ABC transporter, permease protein 1 (cluster 1, maltose/g3p/polyamine/iron) [uncultured Corynebacteriales bacterium]|uniref:ABC transporter, permease protein 1 (Cluster 1, maltose/g3p/polyamine/iron) n=1 Tax=uncultured Mycobacteriales bacterium TaxID=581187 RepID=A0A6J4JPY1_9ACTN|nr:MAG: ABC transporter, permease protein 1 (cluster 1, maltose/g3p/polyamine/iron) [uncultured Corynebacteriales bacterium]